MNRDGFLFALKQSRSSYSGTQPKPQPDELTLKEKLDLVDQLAEQYVPMIALAGVMGGADAEVSDATVDVLVESAEFAPLS